MHLKIKFTNKYHHYVMFYLELTLYTFTTHLIVEFFVLNQVTIHNKCSKHPPTEPMHARASIIMGCRTLSKAPGKLEMVAWSSKTCRWSDLSFSFRAEYIKVF